jgi:methionyl-tRNA formyltransferase
MKKITLAYFGSPDFAASFLEKLITDTTINKLIEVKLVVTQPDAPVGRKQTLTPTPVKIISNKYQIPIVIQINQKDRKTDKSESQKIRISDNQINPTSGFRLLSSDQSDLSEIDLALVYAYGAKIPKEILSLPKYGFWCIHPSLLPKYRGVSPMATPLINGDKITGVTIIKMDDKFDHGPIIAQETITIAKNDTRPDLEKKLTDLGFEMFKKILKTGVEGLGIPTARSRGILSEASTGGKRHETGPVSKLTEQNHKLATYTKKLSKQDGFIEFEKLKNALVSSPYSLTVYNLFRGLYPWPGIWTILPNGKRLKITQLSLTPSPYSLIPIRVQLEGKNEVDFETFNKAYHLF